MSTFNKILKGAKKFVEEVSKPDSFAKGEEFEEYIRKYTFPKDKYDLVHRTHDYGGNKNDYVESSLLPDFQFRDLQTGKEFFVECKFRNGRYSKGQKIEWCNENQLRRYQRIHKEKAPVFIALGIGDKGKDPHEIVLFNLEKAPWTGLYDSFLNKHSFYLAKPVFSGFLWKL